jgi:opacity protein-like surface antigen
MRKLIAVAGVALVAAGSGVAGAQTPVTFAPSVNVGVAFPTGDTGDGLNTGFTVGVGLDAHVPTMPVSWRAEAQYTRFGASDDGSNGVDASLSDVSGRINAVLPLPATGMGPYLIGGIGIYHVKATASQNNVSISTSDNKFGWNIGAGLDLPLGTFKGRIEARYHSVSMDGGNYTYVPVTIGFRF